jgi:hypothetical protein
MVASIARDIEKWIAKKLHKNTFAENCCASCRQTKTGKIRISAVITLQVPLKTQLPQS